MTSDLSQSLREVLIALAPFGAIDIVATGRSYSGVSLAHLGRSTVFAGVPIRITCATFVRHRLRSLLEVGDAWIARKWAPMSSPRHTPIELGQDCDVTLIPSGQRTRLRAGERVVVTQALGGNITVQTERGHLARISTEDASILGLDGGPGDEDTASLGPFELERVFEQLKTVFDPEIPINVVDLGLIYTCDAHLLADGSHRVEIKMSMTAPGCGMGDILKDDARSRVQTVPGVSEVDVELVWDPPWDQSRLTDAARLELGLY